VSHEQDWYERLGRTLRNERRHRGLTQADVAAILDVTGASVSRYERGADRMKAYAYHRLRCEGMLP
jgi:transcriptional regulator with XRE-family HTH domain